MAILGMENVKQHFEEEAAEFDATIRRLIPYHPANLMNQLSWLQNIGFTEVDIIWKYYNFAVYGGVKA